MGMESAYESEDMRYSELSSKQKRENWNMQLWLFLSFHLQPHNVVYGGGYMNDEFQFSKFQIPSPVLGGKIVSILRELGSWVFLIETWIFYIISFVLLVLGFKLGNSTYS